MTNTFAFEAFKTFCKSSQFSYSELTIEFPAFIAPTAAEIYSKEWLTSDQNKTLFPSVIPCSTR